MSIFLLIQRPDKRLTLEKLFPVHSPSLKDTMIEEDFRHVDIGVMEPFSGSLFKAFQG
jgi:hypothetical protein